MKKNACTLNIGVKNLVYMASQPAIRYTVIDLASIFSHLYDICSLRISSNFNFYFKAYRCIPCLLVFLMLFLNINILKVSRACFCSPIVFRRCRTRKRGFTTFHQFPLHLSVTQRVRALEQKGVSRSSELFRSIEKAQNLCRYNWIIT